MAIYRLHRKAWDKGFIGLSRTLDQKQTRTQPEGSETEEMSRNTRRKRSRAEQSSTSDVDAEDVTPKELVKKSKIQRHGPGKQNGISSGLSVVVKSRKSGTEVRKFGSRIKDRRGSEKIGNTKDKWWGTLGS